MKLIKRFLDTQPLTFSILVVLFGAGLSQLPAMILADIFDSNMASPINREYIVVLSRLLIAVFCVVLLIKFKWGTQTGVTTPPSKWRAYWLFAITPMLFIGSINLMNVDWVSVQFGFTGAVFWFLESLSIGMFEEVLLRAVVFFILYRAWHESPYRLYKAAFGQALIFGLVHLINLTHDFKIDVFAQVIYATLIGIGFAGVVAYTRSIWPAVFAHSFIDACGNIENIFNPQYVSTPTDASTYVVLIIIIFFVVTLPGLFCLKKSEYESTDSV